MSGNHSVHIVRAATADCCHTKGTVAIWDPPTGTAAAPLVSRRQVRATARVVNGPGIWLTVLLFGTPVGVDEFGNRYYRERQASGHRERRWVLYRGVAEASAVPPLWQAWLTHTAAEPPTQEKRPRYPWLRPHRPNPTGTAAAHLPPGSLLGTTPEPPRRYQPWTPALDEETPPVPERP